MWSGNTLPLHIAQHHMNTYAAIFFHCVARKYAVYASFRGSVKFNSFSRLLRSELHLVGTCALQPMCYSLKLWI